MKSSWITVLSLLPAIAAGVYAWRADARGRELSGLIADARESEVRARAAADAASSHLEQSAKARALAESALADATRALEECRAAAAAQTAPTATSSR